MQDRLRESPCKPNRVAATIAGSLYSREEAMKDEISVFLVLWLPAIKRRRLDHELKHEQKNQIDSGGSILFFVSEPDSGNRICFS
jgi:hypothetical protein